jgi:ankyrin repeat protein
MAHRGDPNKLFPAAHPDFLEGRKTALMSAAAAGNAKKVTALIDDSKADVHLANEHGLMALHFASNGEVVRALVERGADLHAKVKAGYPHSWRHIEPLELAVDRGDASAITEFAAQGVSVSMHAVDLTKRCCYGNKWAALAALIAAGAPVNEKTMNHAIVCSNLAAVRVLCDAGANLTLKSEYWLSRYVNSQKQYMTPLAAAIHFKLGDIEALLRARGAPLG